MLSRKNSSLQLQIVSGLASKHCGGEPKMMYRPETDGTGNFETILILILFVALNRDRY